MASSRLITDWGAVDVLREIGEGQDYEWLQTRSELIERGGRSVRIVSLPTLIELKRAANRPKDRLAIPVLLATLEARTRDASRRPSECGRAHGGRRRLF